MYIKDTHRYTHIHVCTCIYIYTCVHICVYSYVYIWKERVVMVNRVLLTSRNQIFAYPANKAITQLKQCRTDRVFSEMLSFRMLWATVCKESIRYVKCLWFGLPGRLTPLHTTWFPAVRYSCYLCSHPSAQFGWLKEPGSC